MDKKLKKEQEIMHNPLTNKDKRAPKKNQWI
jgi:hypothetical protein